MRPWSSSLEIETYIRKHAKLELARRNGNGQAIACRTDNFQREMDNIGPLVAIAN